MKDLRTSLLLPFLALDYTTLSPVWHTSHTHTMDTLAHFVLRSTYRTGRTFRPIILHGVINDAS